MLTRFARVPVRALAGGMPAITTPSRNFLGLFKSKTEFGISTDREQQGGRRKQELDAEDKGEVAFNRDPIVPPREAGTKENPILVPSSEDLRAVGYEDPYTHQLVWFNLRKGNLHFIPDINLYFKLDHVDAHGHKAAAGSEKAHH